MSKEEIDLGDTQRFLDNPTVIELKSNGADGGASKPAGGGFSGLSKEEVMKYGSDPSWVKIRWILFVIFWCVWAVMLAAAILLVIFTPKCAPRPKQAWWEKETVYQLSVSTFKDSNDDGTGDFAGLVDKLDYLTYLNAKTIALHPSALDAADAKKLADANNDLKVLRKKLDEKDMHLILDIPYDSIAQDKDLETIKYWLYNGADGVRVILDDKELDKDQADKLKKIVTEATEKTFRAKFATLVGKSSAQQIDGLPYVYTDVASFDEDVYKKSSVFQQKLNESIYAPSAAKPPIYSLGYPKSASIERKRLYMSLAALLKGVPVLASSDELEYIKSDGVGYMKWDHSINCGFSRKQGLLAESVDCAGSAKDARAHGSEDSLSRIYSFLLRLREEPSFSWGEIKFPREDAGKFEHVITFVREAPRFDGYIVAANTATDNKHALIDFKNLFDISEDNSTVVYHYGGDNKSKDLSVGSEVTNDNIKLKPGELLILKYSNDK